MQEKDLARETPRLTDIVCRHDDLRPGGIHRPNHRLDGPGRAGVEAGRWLIQQQHVRPQHRSPRDPQPLLLATRQGAGRPPGKPRQARLGESLLGQLAASRAGHLADLQGMIDVAGGRTTQQHRALQNHGLPAAGRPGTQRVPESLTGGRRHQSMEDSHQQALAGAVGSEDDRAPGRRNPEREILEQPLAAGRIGQPLDGERQQGMSRCRRRSGGGRPRSQLVSRGVDRRPLPGSGLPRSRRRRR